MTLRIIAITQDDPFYMPVFFDRFLDRLQDSDTLEIDRIVIQPSFRESPIALAKRLYGFYGALDFTRLLVRYGCARARAQMGSSPVYAADYAAQYNVPVERISDIHDQSFIDTLRHNRIDIILSVSAPQLFKPALLEAPRIACLNIHNGRLPDYRGMMPNFWQMLNGEPYATSTIHSMAAELDRGSILYEHRTPIESGMSLDSLIRATKANSADAALNCLHAIAEYGALPAPVRDAGDESGAYYPFPRRADARRLKKMGHFLL